MPTIHQNQTDIYYRWAGLKSGPVLVLSHSLGSDLRMWDWQTRRLGKRFRLLLYDHPGHGRSPHRPPAASPVAISAFGQDLLKLLDQLELERVAFCGLSLGGMIGQWLGAHASDRLDRLIIANTAAYIEDKALLRTRIAEIRRNGLDGIIDSVIEKWFTPGFRQSHSEACDHARAMLCRTSAQAYADTAETVCELDLRSRLAQIDVPTLVLCGQWDEATPPAWNRDLAGAIPDARLIVLPAAHLSNIEAADAFNEAVVEFLS